MRNFSHIKIKKSKYKLRAFANLAVINMLSDESILISAKKADLLNKSKEEKL